MRLVPGRGLEDHVAVDDLRFYVAERFSLAPAYFPVCWCWQMCSGRAFLILQSGSLMRII